ncbi:MAG: transcriptional regulator [Sulfurimonas sp. RIFOXYB2_FULL_37_5]|jgi:transcriptional regulator with XRE-family HTH domain|uniref:helix-turn-helix domain-containing protein n=1 Tax=Sulfurimonas sp. RIFOXYB12_FULL_35_9 TaxID=1802256 RepID=UPI0008C10790|nr:helix-turn-helix transcriptional regulator [Sulfurimonas sp. RIFOXYB12_FULL_35_9]OHE06053.1 MAG: transcriptional regulator [Sulfurimonas sp. RIFOXYB12_FULL_35_9]OHE12397.1 MAG: transcriptional regulator [Sulfurimonas sp. RIFOXYB2_FULL_37_5]
MLIEDLDKKTEEIHNIISTNVIKYRKGKGFSQLQLALDIGLTGNAFIARAEKRTNNAHFNIEHIVKIATILDIDIKEFFIE